jgi:hypothetical protein
MLMHLFVFLFITRNYLFFTLHKFMPFGITSYGFSHDSSFNSKTNYCKMKKRMEIVINLSYALVFFNILYSQVNCYT